MVEKCSQSDLVEILHTLHHELCQGKLPTLNEHVGIYKMCQSEMSMDRLDQAQTRPESENNLKL